MESAGIDGYDEFLAARHGGSRITPDNAAAQTTPPGPSTTETHGHEPAPIVGSPGNGQAERSPSPLAGLAISTSRRLRREQDAEDGRPGLSLIYSHRMLQEYRQQTREYREQTKAEREARQSAPEDEVLRHGPLDTIEPPFPLEALTCLLYDAADFYAIVDRIATDVCGPWSLVDVEEVSSLDELPEVVEETEAETQVIVPGDIAGEIPAEFQAPARPPSRDPDEVESRARDAQAIEQRQRGKLLLESLTFDLAGKIKLRDFGKMVIKDYKTTGNSGVEVGRDDQGRIKVLVYIPFRLTRKLAHNRGWVQIDYAQKPAAYFRNWQSNPDDEESRLSDTELKSVGKDNIQEPGQLKSEFYHFKHHHPNEIHYGVPPIIPALGAVRGNMYADARNLHYFLNRAVPDYLTLLKADTLTLTGEGTREILDQFEDALDEQLQLVARGSNYENATIRIPKDVMEFEMMPLGSAINDAEFREYKKDNRDTQMRMYGMSPQRMGIIETASLGSGSGENQNETYKRAIVDPDQEMLEDLFNAILDDYGLTLVRFKFMDIDIVDEQREMQLYTAASNTGAISVNEEREWLSRITSDQDFPEWEADDEADIPKNLRDSGGDDFGAGQFGNQPGNPLLAQTQRAGLGGEPSGPVQPQASLPPPQRRRDLSPADRAFYQNVGKEVKERQRIRQEARARAKNGNQKSVDTPAKNDG